MNFVIHIIGCGGNGSRLLDKIGNYVMSQNVNPYINLIDEDIVEEKNVERQRFHFRDIGKPKAQVLAERFERDHRYSNYIDYHNTFANCDEAIRRLFYRGNSYYKHLFFLTVDNNPTRKLFWEYLKGDATNIEPKFNYRKWAIIDCGNTSNLGQCVTTAYVNGQLIGSDPRLLYPNMQNIQGDIPTSGGSCGVNHISQPQTLMANEMTSLFAYNSFYEIVHNQRILPRQEWCWMFPHPATGELTTGMDIDECISFN